MNLLRRHQYFIFGVVWVTYCVVYFLRKPLGIVKPEIEAVMHLSKSELGWLDLSLLLPYAGVQICLSSLWDRAAPRRVVALCLALCSAAMLAFGASGSLPLACACLFASGAGQAPIWPACTKVLSAWFPQDHLSSVFGMISTAPYVGALAGTALAIYVQDVYGWRFVFLPAGCAGLVCSALAFAAVRMPKELQIDIPGNLQTTASAISPTRSPAKKSSHHWRRLSSLWSIPGVSATAASVFCLKFVRYCMYMWLPLYLIEHLGYPKIEGGLFSTMFDVGGIVGGPALGILVDRYFPDKPLLGISYALMGGTVTFGLIPLAAPWGRLHCSALLFLAGAANCGPDSLLTGSVTMMIGERYGTNSGAGVTSLVNGVGSVGAIIEGPLVGLVSQHVGWHGVIGCMLALTLASTVAALRAHLTLRAADREASRGAAEEERQRPLVPEDEKTEEV